MKRLTFLENEKWVLKQGNCTTWAGKNEELAQCAIDRLAAYEDTGLEPQEIETTLANYSAFLWHATNGRMSKTNYTVEAMRSEADNCIMEMCNDCEYRQRAERYEDAEAEGRLVVLPCKVGDRVYVNPDTWFYSVSCYENRFIHSKHFLVGEIVSVIKTKKQRLIKIRVSNSIHSRHRYKRYPSGAIGKTLFLTREEAEEALRRKTNERTTMPV